MNPKGGMPNIISMAAVASSMKIDLPLLPNPLPPSLGLPTNGKNGKTLGIGVGVGVGVGGGLGVGDGVGVGV